MQITRGQPERGRIFFSVLLERTGQKPLKQDDGLICVGKMVVCTIFSNILNWLVVWNMNFMTFHILGISSSQLTLLFFRGVGIPPTRYIFISHYSPVKPYQTTILMSPKNLCDPSHHLWDFSVRVKDLWCTPRLKKITSNETGGYLGYLKHALETS